MSEVTPRQIVFDWLMGEQGEGWWGTSDQVEHVDELLKLLNIPPPAVWSRETPTEPGFYWYRDVGVSVLTIVEVCWHTSVVRSHLRAFFVSGRQAHIEDLGGEFSLPLRPPVEGPR